MTKTVTDTDLTRADVLKASVKEAVADAKQGAQYDVADAIKRINDASGADAAEGHKRTALRIQEIVALIRAIEGSLELEKAFDMERRRHQVQPPQVGANPYYVHVRVCQGEWAPDEGNTEFDGLKNLTVWKPNGSSLKYAQVIREALFHEWPTDEVAQRIRDYINPTTGKPGINGMIQADSERHKGPPRIRTQGWRVGEKAAARQAVALGSFTTSDTSFGWTEDFVMLLARKGKNGVVEIIGDAGVTGDAVVQAVRKRVLKVA